MDYRERNYYYYKFDQWSGEMRFDYFKIAAPSVKFHFNNYLHDIARIGSNYSSCMISCKKEESEVLECELEKSVKQDYWAKYFKITKDMLKQ